MPAAAVRFRLCEGSAERCKVSHHGGDHLKIGLLGWRVRLRRPGWKVIVGSVVVVLLGTVYGIHKTS